MKYFALLLILSNTAFAECRYKMIEQNGTYFAIKKVLGNLPEQEHELADKLKIGINDVSIVNKEEDSFTDTDQEVRVKVRFQSENKKEVESFVKKFCP